MNSAINPVQQGTQMDDDIPRYRDLRNDFILPPSIVSQNDDDFTTPKKPIKPHSINAPERPAKSARREILSVSKILF